jgi:hypothetical protein
MIFNGNRNHRKEVFKKCIVGYLFTYAIVSKLVTCLFCPLPEDYGKI